MSKSWEQILGGYATGTLTEEEKRQLFEAALDDQALFDALADEEGLRALLANPEARQRILDSLQGSGAPQGIAETHNPRLRWYRQSSSLAWAGSMAAMGLALLFGWQMEALWGPVVQEELQAERSLSEAKDEKATPPEASKIELKKSPVREVQKKLKSEPTSVISPPLQTPVPKPPAMANASKDRHSMEQASAPVPSDRASRQVVKKERRLQAKKQNIPSLESALEQSASQEYRAMTPSAGNTGTREEDFQQLPQAQTFADRMPQNDAPSSMGARDLSSSKKDSRSLGEQDAMKSKRAPQLFGGMSTGKEGALQEFASAEKRPQTSSSAAVAPSRGIRYRFIQRTTDGKEIPIDIDQLAGNWANLQLGITSTVPGYLYVMKEVKKGNWEWLKTETQNLPRSSDGAIYVMPNETVVFSFNPLPHDLGRPLISSVSVLLSSTPISDLGNWLGADQRQDQIRQPISQDILVIDRNPNSQEPFRVDIPLVR